MSARKIDINPKIEVGGCLDEMSGVGVGQEAAFVVSDERVTKNKFKGLIEQIFQFVSVGGDFV